MNKRVIQGRIIRYSSEIFGDMSITEGAYNIPCWFSVFDFETNAKVNFRRAYNKMHKKTGCAYAFDADCRFTVYECLEALMEYSKLVPEDRQMYLNWLKAIAEDVKNDTL